jgi:hypothetical protein
MMIAQMMKCRAIIIDFVKENIEIVFEKKSVIHLMTPLVKQVHEDITNVVIAKTIKTI